MKNRIWTLGGSFLVKLCDYNAKPESCKVWRVVIGETGRLASRAEVEVDYLLLMASAMHAAPKPLSILTTATPGAQLLSIPRRAAMPPKLAP